MLLVGSQDATDARETAWQFLTQVNVHLARDPAVPLPDVYPREAKADDVQQKPVLQSL